jgi:hypothetical protein
MERQSGLPSSLSGIVQGPRHSLPRLSRTAAFKGVKFLDLRDARDPVAASIAAHKRSQLPE